MALTEIGARLRLEGASAFKKDAEGSATALGKVAKQAGAADKHVSQLERTAKRAKSALGGMTIGKMAGLAGIGAATATVTAFGKASVDAYKDATREAIGLQRVMGGTVEDASRLGNAAHESGVGIDVLSKSTRLLSKNLIASEKMQQVRTRSHKMEIVTVPRLVKGQIKYVKALRDTGTTTTKFVKISKDLGFTWRDAHGQILPMAKLLPRIAERFKTMPNGVEKTALAMKLFGKGGADMLPFLNRGADGIKELVKQSDRLGETVTAKDAAGMKQYTMAMRDWDAAIRGVKINLGRELMPAFTQWATFLGDHAPEINAWGRKYIPELGHGLAEAGRDAKQVGDAILPPLRWMSNHPYAVKGVAEGMAAYAFYTKSATIWSTRLAGTSALGGVATKLAAIGGASGASAAAGGVAALGAALFDIAGPAAAAYGTLKRIADVVKGIRGDLGPLLHLSDFGLGDKPKDKRSTQDIIAGMTPAKREQFYGWYPNLRPPTASTVIPSNKPHVNPNGRGVIVPNVSRIVRANSAGKAQLVTVAPVVHVHGYKGTKDEAQRLAKELAPHIISDFENRAARQ